jgi:hypothetical protein
MPDITATRPVSGAPVESAWGTQVHDMLEGIQVGGPVSIATPASAFGVTWVAQTFPRAYTVAPKVFGVNASGSGIMIISVRNVTTTGFDIGAARGDGNPASATASAHWLAVGTIA